jgi:hypothetical protein
MQGLKVELDEHKKTTFMFQQTIEYNVHMINVLLKLSDLEIKNKQIIEEKDRSVQNVKGALEKE